MNVDLLENIPLFQGIKKEDLKNLLVCLTAKEKNYHAGAIIYHNGHSLSDIGIILSGQVQIVRDDLYGQHNILANLSPHNMFGESYAYMNTKELPISIICMKDSHILLIPHHKIIRSCSSNCSFHSILISNMLQILAQKNFFLNQKLECLEKRSTREKLLTFFQQEKIQKNSVSFDIPFTRQGLADYLCVERSGLSTELNKLKKEGLLDFDKQHFTLFFHNEP